MDIVFEDDFARILDSVLAEVAKKATKRYVKGTSLVSPGAYNALPDVRVPLTVALGKLAAASYDSGFKAERKALVDIAVLAIETLAGLGVDAG